MIAEETLKALKLLEEKEPPISNECFQEYLQGTKTLKTIAKEKMIKYSTVRHYSKYYKYKARKEILYSNTTATPTPTTSTNKTERKTTHRKRKHHTKIKNIHTDNYTPLKQITAPNILSPVGVPPKEDESITKIIQPTKNTTKKSKLFHEYIYKAEVEVKLFLTDSEKRTLLRESRNNSYTTLEDYITQELKEVTLSIDNIKENNNNTKNSYNKQEDTLKLHDLNMYKPKLFSENNIIKDTKQITLDELL